MTINNEEKWIALNPKTYDKHMCLGREQEYDRDCSDELGLSGVGPGNDGKYLTTCKYCHKLLLWKLMVERGEEEKEKKKKES
jgi:hypothetical protein